jgi:hypothetical protein
MAKPFNWNNQDEPDLLEGFDTDPEPTPPPAPAVARPVEPPRQIVPKGNPKKEPEMDLGVADDWVEESPEKGAGDYTEAEWRLEKAQFYRAIIGNQLLSSNHPAAIEVEKELQEWAHRKFENLLGIGSVDKPVPAPNLPFNEEEIDALKAVAAKVLRKSEQAPATVAPVVASPPKPTTSPVPAVRPVATPPKAAVQPVKPREEQRANNRGGRPRKNPCRICGQMECEHKQRAPKVTEDTPVVQTPMADSFQGVKVQVVNGQRIVDMPNGVRYRLDRRKVQYKDGTIKEEDIPVELGRPQQGGNPYPSEQEAMALAVAESANNERRVQASPIFQKLVDAAIKAPEREPYIPQPPSKR